MTTQTQSISDGNLAKDTTVAAPAYHTEFKTEPAEAKAGEAVVLVFTVRDANGKVARDLQVVHEKLMHLLVVSTDLSEFYHLHTEQAADGSFRVAHIFPHAGNYQLYADYTPPGANQIVDQFSLQISGQAGPAIALTEDESGMKAVDGLRITMQLNQPLRAGEEVMLDFVLADEQTNQPITDLQPYLGALAHFVIISEEGVEFLHAHPMEKTETLTVHGVNHEAMPHTPSEAMTIHSSHLPQTSASQVSAHTRFPHAGLYKVWAQFQRAGQIITVPFVVRVADSEKP